MKKVILSSVVLLVFFLTSCKKDIAIEQADSQVKVSEPTYPRKYKIDGKEVTKEGFFETLLGKTASLRNESGDMGAVAERYHVLFELARPETNGTFNVTNAFTSSQFYIDYAVSSGHSNAAVVEQAYSDLADYAESSGAIAATDQTGVVPADYLRYMNDYLQHHSLPYDNGLQTRSLGSFINKECDNGGAGWFVARNPSLGMYGYNDNISRYLNFGLGTRTDIFDRSFFRTRLASIWQWGLTSVIFCEEYQHVDNKATSWFTLI